MILMEWQRKRFLESRVFIWNKMERIYEQTEEEIGIWGYKNVRSVEPCGVPSFEKHVNPKVSKYWQGIAKEISERINESERLTEDDLSLIVY